MKYLATALLAAAVFPAFAQTGSAPNPWAGLEFLKGTWGASTQGGGGVQASGSYAFVPELGGHVLARHATNDASCKAPSSFDCDHHDLLYVYEEAPGQPLKAIYFDNEGHVIHYGVTTPSPATAVFLSEPGQGGPRFRLQYELKEAVMHGKFEMQMPGQSDWKAYLEWSGSKR